MQKVGGFLFGSKKCPELNSDCMLTIVEELDFLSLLNMAQTNKFFAAFAIKVYERKFSNQTIVIDHYSPFNFQKYIEMGAEKIIDIMAQHSDLPLKQLGKYYHQYKDDNNIIKIKNLKMAKNVLTYFGNDIRKMRINTENADSNELKFIIKLLNEYCSESLIELGLRIDHGEALNYFTKPFKNVKHISFERNLPAMDRGVLPMNETFPALRSLSVSLWEVNSDYLFQHFQYLEHLRLDLGINGNPHFVFELFKFYRHIRSLELNFATSQHLLLANMILRELEHLTLGCFQLTDGIMFFPHVIKFTIKDFLSSPNNLLFVRLEELEIHFYPIRYFEWMAFLDDHIGLIRFHLNYFDMDDACFERLTIGLTSLQEMTISRLQGEHLGADTVSKFIENHENLMKLILKNTCSATDYEFLFEKYSNEWNITKLEDGLLLGRNSII